MQRGAFDFFRALLHVHLTYFCSLFELGCPRLSLVRGGSSHSQDLSDVPNTVFCQELSALDCSFLIAFSEGMQADVQSESA